MNEHLGITVGTKHRAQRLEITADVEEIVDHAVEHQRDLGVGTQHRLRASPQINNRQPSMA